MADYDGLTVWRTSGPKVLGLVKAQQVKNAVIVPVGSKGGFVVKNPPPPSDRDLFMKEGVECYKTFLRGLLDLTDEHLVANQLVPPQNVVRHDGDDPYLVVAADKGTASFPTMQTKLALNTIIGWVTHLPLEDRLVTTTKKWESPPVVPGNRSNVTSLRLAWIRRQPTSPSSASVTCRATSSVMECCFQGISV